MKKFLSIFVIILIILSLFVFLYRDKIFIEKNIRKLSEIGYSDKEIKLIKSLDDSNIDLIIKEKHINNISDLLKNKNFNKEKLNLYLDLLNKKINIDDILYIVNNNYYNKNINYDTYTIELMKSKYYINNNLERYLNYKNDELTTNEIIRNVNCNLDYEFYNHDIKTDITKSNLMLVNKFYKLDNSYVPNDLVNIDSKYGNGQANKEVYNAFINMNNEANKNGLSLKITSPYRSYNTQYSLYNRYVNRDGKNAADTYSARAGYSEHQTGLALDIITSATTLGSFESSEEFNWLKDNCYKYGFILRYPKGKEYITGYQYESWHYRYVGIDVATKIKDLDITLEEYYEFFVK